MIYLFTCSTKDCENEKNPVRLLDATNPVTCSICYKSNQAVETDEVLPEATPEI
jgi:hypothetical protein